jgi:ER-bound oxygenase mpaB/B'/Rubber oxygenase, catalytic domain
VTAALVLPDDVLAALRTIGDPPTEGRTGRTIAAVPSAGLRAMSPDDQSLRARLRKHAARPPLDYAKLAEAQRLFAEYGSEIAAALLLAVLPQSYATAFGVQVLAANAELVRDPARRIRRTAQFVIDVTTRATKPKEQRRLWDPDFTAAATGEAFRPWERCELLRAHHAALRMRLTAADGIKGSIGPENKTPINQEDLLALQLSLTITVFEVLERFGISWTTDEQEAYLHLWDVVGAHLGIGSDGAVSQLQKTVAKARKGKAGAPPVPVNLDGWIGLRPPTIAQTRALLEQLRARQWINTAPTGPLDATRWTSARSGRVLTKALLDELAAAMPRPLKLLPITVMRALAPDVVRARLSLGANGLVVGALVSLPPSRAVTARFTSVRVYNQIGSRALRAMGREVAVRASLSFLKAGDLTVPGLELTTS